MQQRLYPFIAIFDDYCWFKIIKPPELIYQACLMQTAASLLASEVFEKEDPSNCKLTN